MKVPRRADWGEIDENDLDAGHALKQFFGKSFVEAEEMFQRNALHYQEDLQSMPAAAFNYYAPALAKYIISENARGDSDGASSFLHMVAWILKENRDVMAPETEKLLVDVAGRVSRNQPFYDADEDIYGRFSDIYLEINNLVENRI